MTREGLKQKIKCEADSPDITEMELPIHKRMGEGFSFECDGEKYTTEASDLVPENLLPKDKPDFKNKRKLYFYISSFRGISAGASHFYCEGVSYITNVNQANRMHSIAGGLGDVVIPKENRTLDFHIVRPITQAEIDSDQDRWFAYYEGDLIDAFENENTILKIIEELKEVFPQDEWEFVIQ